MPTLRRIFGSKAQTQLVQYLLDHRGRLYNQAGLARLLDMSPTTIARVIVSLVEEGILEYEQVSGQMKIIALNEENDVTKALIAFHDAITRLR
jgi:DNA-binding GntR family transcriptional regulator